MRGCCCPPAAVLLLLRAAESSRRRVASVARSRRALGSRRRKMCEGTEGHRSAVVASVLRPLAFFFLRFLRFFFFFVVDVESLPGLLEFVGAAILLGLGPLCVYKQPARGRLAAPKQLQLGGARTRLLFFGDVVGGVLPGLVLLGDRWGDSSRPAALAQTRRCSETRKVYIITVTNKIGSRPSSFPCTTARSSPAARRRPPSHRRRGSRRAV